MKQSAKNLQQPIRIHKNNGFKVQRKEIKTEHTIIWKSIKSWAEKLRQIVCNLLFELFSCVTSSGMFLYLTLTIFFTYLCLRWHFSNCSEIGLLLPGHPGAAAIAALGCRRSCNRRSLSSVTAPSRETTVLPRVVVLKRTADGTGVGALKWAILQLYKVI